MRSLMITTGLSIAALTAPVLATAQTTQASGQTPAPMPPMAHMATSAPVTASAPPAAPTPYAVAALTASDGTQAGTVTAFRGPQGTVFHVEGKAWPTGWHGVHLHSVGTCDGPAFTSAGGHLNHADHPSPHGLLNADGGPDLGDLQNVYAGADGTAHADVYRVGPQDLLAGAGVSFVVHANADDYVSQPIGGAGARIACGVFHTAGTVGQ